MNILRYLAEKLLKLHYLRVSALLANLDERRKSGWKLHLATETGPMTFKQARDLEEGEERPVEEKKVVKKGPTPAVDFEKGLQ